MRAGPRAPSPLNATTIRTPGGAPEAVPGHRHNRALHDPSKELQSCGAADGSTAHGRTHTLARPSAYPSSRPTDAPPVQPPPRGSSMTEHTDVELLWIEGRIERWIRFGDVIEERIRDRNRRIVSFAPDSVFAFIRWASNDYGTLVSRIDIVRACRAGEPRVTVPGITPGGDVLLRLSGWPKVEVVLEAIDAVETLGLRPQDVCPDHWRQVYSRLSTGRTPECYTRQRHRAWLIRREMAS